jgi:streptogramin lyase
MRASRTSRVVTALVAFMFLAVSCSSDSETSDDTTAPAATEAPELEPEPEPEPATTVAPEPATTDAPQSIVAFTAPTDIVVEADGGLMVVDAWFTRLVRVDPVTADRTISSGIPGATGEAVVGDGAAFGSPVGVDVEADGNLLVLDVDLAAVFRVDPVTGDRTIVSDANTGSGPAFERLYGGIAVEADGNVVVTAGAGAVIRVDPVTGDRTIVSDADTGSGPAFGAPLGNVASERSIAVEADGNLLVLDAELVAVFRVDPVTGDRTIVSDADTGSGAAFGAPLRGVAVEADGNVVVTVVAAGAAGAVIRVDPVTGDRTIVSDASTGDGGALLGAYGIAVEADGNLVVTDDLLWAVIRVDPVSGDRTNASL